MKVLAVTMVCLVAITTTHGFGFALPPFGGIGVRPIGLGMPPFGFGMPPFGLGIHPLSLGLPHLGIGIPPVGLGVPTAGHGISPLGVGNIRSVNQGSVKQGSVQTGTQGVTVIGSHGNGHDDKYDAYAAAAAASYGAAAPTTIDTSAVAPTEHAAYDSIYIVV